MRVYLIDWKDQNGQDHVSLVRAKTRERANDLFELRHMNHLVSPGEWGVENVPMREGIEDLS